MKMYHGVTAVLTVLAVAGSSTFAATPPRGGPAAPEPQRVFKRSGALPRPPTRPVYHSPPINAFSLSDLQPHKDRNEHAPPISPKQQQFAKPRQLFQPSLQAQQQREYFSAGSGEDRYFGSQNDGGKFSSGSQYNFGGQGLKGSNYGEQSLGGSNYGGQSLGGQNYGGQSLGGSNYGGQILKGSNYGGQSLGGQSYGGQSLGGSNYGAQSLGGSNYGAQSLGANYGAQSLGGSNYGAQSLGANYGAQSLGGSNYGGQSPGGSKPGKLSAEQFAAAAAAFLPGPVKVPKLLVATHVKHANIVHSGGSLHNDVVDEQGHDAHYEFSYDVIHEGEHGKGEGQFFGHAEKREGPVTRGRYHVLLPDGRHQKVAYLADHSGYHAQVSYN